MILLQTFLRESPYVPLNAQCSFAGNTGFQWVATFRGFSNQSEKRRKQPIGEGEERNSPLTTWDVFFQLRAQEWGKRVELSL
jgi:hypothetical protein